MQLAYRRAHVGEEHHVVHNLTNRHPRVVNQHQVGRQYDNEHRAYLLHKSLQPLVDERDAARLHLLVGALLLKCGLLRRLQPLAVERLDDAHALYDVQYTVAQLLMGAEHTVAPALHAASLHGGNPKIDGNDGGGHEAHVDVGGIHQHQRQHGAGEKRQDVDKEVLHRVAEAHDAAVDARLQLAGLIAVLTEESHAERQYAVDHPQREVAAHIDAYLLAEDALSEGDERRQHLLAEQDDANGNQDLCRRAPLEAAVEVKQGVDGVDSTVEHHGVDLRHERPCEGQHQRDRQQPAIGQHKRQQPPQQPTDTHLRFLILTHLLVFFTCKKNEHRPVLLFK